MIAATNFLYLAKFAPTNADFKEHEHLIDIDDVQAIAFLQRTRKETEEIDMLEKAIPTKMIKLIINTLNLDSIIPEEQALGYYTRKKLKKLSTWDEWFASEKQQIDQFMLQGMFGEPVDCVSLPDNATIL